jgi:hypothetical protein
LLNDPMLYLFNCAFTATLLQGIASPNYGKYAYILYLDRIQKQ